MGLLKNIINIETISSSNRIIQKHKIMKESKKEIENAIIIVGESLGMKDATKLLLINVGVHSTVRELTYKMFCKNKQQYFEKDDDVFEAISIIRKYCEEMSTNGEVNFNVKYS